MDNAIAAKLLQLNAEFYQTFAYQFSDTRQRIQPGVRKILDSIDPAAKILDLGCGNGELARELSRHNFEGQYLGLDFSAELLNMARNGTSSLGNFSFIEGNLADTSWLFSVRHHILGEGLEMSVEDRGQTPVQILHPQFSTILAFAALHHIPGREAHLRILRSVRSLLTTEGRFVHSNWQFLNSERLRKRVHHWEEIGLSDSDVGPNDYLLDWRRGGLGMRYVHHFSEDELNALAADTGFHVVETFYSDGETGDLGLYQVWKLQIEDEC